MFTSTSNDLTIESAVRAATGSAAALNDWDEIVAAMTANQVRSMVHDTYGSRNIAPSRSEYFRGFPKPQIDVNIVETDIGSGNRRLDAVCKMRYSGTNLKVGFPITVTITGDYNDGTTFSTIAAYGNNTGTITTGSSGVNINGITPNATSTTPTINYSSIAYTCSQVYYAVAVTGVASPMSWVDPDPIIHAYSWSAQNGLLDCADWIAGATETVYSDASSLSVGIVLYEGNRASNDTLFANKHFKVNGDDIMDTDGDGEITAIENC
jgi:hypothetical protein